MLIHTKFQDVDTIIGWYVLVIHVCKNTRRNLLKTASQSINSGRNKTKKKRTEIAKPFVLHANAKGMLTENS